MRKQCVCFIGWSNTFSVTALSLPAFADKSGYIEAAELANILPGMSKVGGFELECGNEYECGSVIFSVMRASSRPECHPAIVMVRVMFGFGAYNVAI